MKIDQKEFHPYYTTYIEKASETSILEGLRKNLDANVAFYKSIPKDKEAYRYEEGKWTIKDILLHIIDAERVFAYRCLRIGRGDTTPLSGFDQNIFVESANANSRSMSSLIEEYVAVRQSTIRLFESFTDADLLRMGVASDSDASVRAVGYIIIGHENHHCEVIKDRYLAV